MREFSFTPTYEDLLAGQLLLNGKAMKRVFPWTLLIGLMAISTTILNHGFSDPAKFIYDLIPYALMLLIAWFVVRKIYVPRSARKMMRLQKNLSRPYVVEWDDEHIRVTSKSGNSETAFSDYACWLANDKVILLFASQSLFYFYPRRAFSDEAAWAAFKATVAGIAPSRWPPK